MVKKEGGREGRGGREGGEGRGGRRGTEKREERAKGGKRILGSSVAIVADEIEGPEYITSNLPYRICRIAKLI